MERRNYHSGLSVGPEHLNALEDYTDKRTEDLAASTIGWGVISGYGASMEGGFALGIAPGLAYDSRGRRLRLDGGLQINLAGLAPAVGLKTVKVGIIFAYDKSEPALDLSSNTVMTKWVETAALVKGDNLPTDAILLYEVALSSAAITLITPAYRIFETPMSAIARTKGFNNVGSALTLEGASAKFMRPDGFTLDLVEGHLRRITFDPLHGPYKKGDILWLEPPTYDTQSTPPAGGSIGYPHTVPAEQAFMGKEITYSAPTDFRQHAVRLRALVDNPRNPNIVGAIGSDWAVDDPSAIVEEGSNSNGGYVLYANFEAEAASVEKAWTYAVVATGCHGAVSFTLPISMSVSSSSVSLKNTYVSDSRGFVVSVIGNPRAGMASSYTVILSLLSGSTATFISTFNVGVYIKGKI